MNNIIHFSIEFQRIVFFLSCLSSFCAIIFIIIYRNKFPFNKVNTPAIFLIECWIPSIVLSGSINWFNEAPCWFIFYQWNPLISPVGLYLIFAVIRLWLDYRYNVSKYLGTSTFISKYYNLLTNPLLLFPIFIILTVEAWMDILPTLFIYPVKLYTCSGVSNACLNLSWNLSFQVNFHNYYYFFIFKLLYE